ncbi:hypothetical protein DER46DRAFT_704463 [Fusarium sp. MPI-SDFR-AT-0072]|nr:hypothetical protein DER46DRAFT_704463 [Fusarium sp. MPI-SDFR-AT-0072]
MALFKVSYALLLLLSNLLPNMDLEEDPKSTILQPQKPPRFRNLGLALRALALSVAISGIVVAAIPASRNAIAIGILGPAFITALCWSLIELVCSVTKTLPTIRPSFSLVIHCFIALGSVACLACFGWFGDWWPGGSALDNDTEPSEPLFLAALVLACVSTGPYENLTDFMDMKKQRIVIAGGGLGGLTAACRLARDGHQVDQLERSPSLSTPSGAIFVRSNGVRCFYRWQMREAFEAVTALIKEHETRNGNTNELLHTLDPGIYSDMQGRDQGALWNENVIVEEDDQAAYATCKDGTRITAGLILAADGISCHLRSQVLAHVDPSRLTVIRAPSSHYPTEIPAEMLDSDDRSKSLREQPESENDIMWAGNGGCAIGKYTNCRRMNIRVPNPS